MNKLLLVNPRKRRSTRRRKSSTTRRRRRTYRRNPARAASAAPVRRRRRRSSSRRRSAGRYFSRARRSVSRFRASNIGNFVTDKLVPASIGASGALLLDLGWGYLPIPASLKTGMLAPVARIGGALAIGYGVGMIAGKRIGQEAMAGALIVTIYDLLKTTLKANTSLPLSGMGYYSPGMVAAEQYDALEFDDENEGLGMFVGDENEADAASYDEVGSYNS